MRSRLALLAALALLASAASAQCREWSSLSGASGPGAAVRTLCVYDSGSGPALYAGGSFTSVGSTAAAHVACWNGTSWSALATGVDGDVNALAVFDDGTGPALFAGGTFTHAGGVATGRIGRWNGSSWSAPGLGIGNGIAGTPAVNALAVFDDGTGPALWVGGFFNTAGGAPAKYLARWNGTAWWGSSADLDAPIHGLGVFDGGAGPDLYAAGMFTNTGVTPLNDVARWTGTGWSALGTGLGGWANTMLAHDDGSGPALYVGGNFGVAGGAPALRIARWNGTSWSPVAGGLGGPCYALARFDDGSGPALYAGGAFTNSPATFIARWNGSSWSAVDTGVDDFVRALAVWSDGSDPAPDLYAAGDFLAAGGRSAMRVAEWAACSALQPFCTGDGNGGACPCANTGAHGRGCANSIFTAGARLAGAGTASVANDGVVLSASELTGTACVFFQGDASAPPAAIDDGLGCVSGNLIRLGTLPIGLGTANYPSGSNPPISLRGALPAAGGTRHYQCFYRNAAAAFCPPAGSNRTNGVTAAWTP